MSNNAAAWAVDSSALDTIPITAFEVMRPIVFSLPLNSVLTVFETLVSVNKLANPGPYTLLAVLDPNNAFKASGSG